MSFQVVGLVHANGRRGALNLVASLGDPKLTCTGFTPAPCVLTTGPQGETVRVVEFERPVPAGQPRDIEIQAIIYRTSGSWVDISINNAEAPYSVADPTQHPAHTGEEPPLTIEQAKALVSDPTLDACATACGPGS